MIHLLVGQIETGKSTALINWIKGKTNVYGILSPVDDNKKRGFFNIETKEKFAMQADSEEENVISIGRYHFYKSAFKMANSIIIQNVKTKSAGYIIIDELGKLELKSQGLHASALTAIEKTRNNKKLHTILVVRDYLLENIKNHYKITNGNVLTISSLSSLG
ncbi:hypothetical protein J4050_10675 [Winogradskyella sp. DF17]|uniref:Guanylate kinase n=1 Tax=Winogradskyella pelagia TaxID=2819984 RepID=A0ABS3T446_9FLAO|nr:nucleoside-triphosphatase [Winogradskyella sp. DF17]MBO3117214.1 hypothetical protein [Winogradskyella sp. DF17]